MASVNTLTTLDGLFKVVYGDNIVNLLPEFAKVSKMVPFKEREMIGEQYQIPVKLQHEHGFSYAGSGEGAFALNQSIAGQMKKAIVNSNQIVLRSTLDYESAYKSIGDKRAFKEATETLIENMSESFAKRLELSLLYGQQGLGQVSVVGGTLGTPILTISAASWAPGIWSGMREAQLEIFDTQSISGATQRAGFYTVVSVDITTRQVTLTASASTLVVANDHLYYLGSRTATAYKEMAGIDKILINTGTLFNIDAAIYELWKGNTYNVGGPLTMAPLQLALSQAVALGLNEDCIVLVAPKRWSNLNNDEAALRQYDYSYDKNRTEKGTEAISYYGVSGKVDIISHPFVKEGEGFILPMKRVKRIGATDITFRRPGRPDNIFRELVDNAGFELRQYCNQAVFIEAPAMCVKLTGIT